MLTGTFVNIGAVLIGTAAGTLFGERMASRIRETLMHALGLATILIGIDGGLAAFRAPLSTLTRASVVVILGSVLLGGVIGELIGIERRLDRVGENLKRRFGRSQAHFTEGFVVASLVFCVGPLTILGSIENGLTGDFELLAVKSLLDGFAALAFASTLGWGVGFSVVTILAYQGGLSIGASSVERLFTPEIVAALTAAGGILIMGIGLRLLELRPVRVGNLLPALVLAPAAVAVIAAFH